MSQAPGIGNMSPEANAGKNDFVPLLARNDRFTYIWMNLALLALVYAVYRFIPFYKAMLRPESVTAIHVILAVYIAWLAVYKPKDVENAKPVLVVRFIPRLWSWFKGLFNPDVFTPGEALLIDHETKVSLISLAIKVIFFPLMINQVFANHDIILKVLPKAMSHGATRVLFDAWYSLIYHSASFIGTALFAFCYAFEFGKYRIKDVEDRLSGWFVTLICYEPFIEIAFRYLPVKQSMVNPFFLQDWIYYPYRTLTLALWICWFLSALSLGLRASNLTNRGIVTSGFYGWVRHPSYLFKNIAFWLERFPFMSSPVHFFSMLAWNLIYILRALTEERYLKRDPDYLEYCKKVKYRFIPGLF